MNRLIITVACMLLLASCLSAQELTHKRFTTSSGGGTSSDGVYVNQVVMGQITSEQSSDGEYDNGGGFFGGADDWMTDIEEVQLPLQFELSQNYPNPFNPNTTIMYSLPEPSHVSLEIYNILGQKTATLISEYQDAGNHTVMWQANDMSSGMYFYRIVAADHTESRKMLLLK